MSAKKPERWGKCPQCGREFCRKLRKRTETSHGGGVQPQTYCSRTCSNLSRGQQGSFVDKRGYVILNGGRRGAYRKPEHRAVMERIIGRELTPSETVHHKNGVRHDNRPENLELWSNRHGRGQRVADQHIPVHGTLNGSLGFGC